MIARRLLCQLAAACVWCAGPADAAITAADDRAAAVTLDRPAARIITMSPHLTQLV